MKIKLIFLISHNFDRRNRIRLGYYHLTSNKDIDITYWNIKNCNKTIKNLKNEEYFSEFYKSYDSKIVVIKNILNLKSKNVYYIDHTSNSIFDNFLQFLFFLKGYKRIFIKAGSVPTFEDQIGKFKYTKLVFKDNFVQGIIKIFVYLLRKIIQPKANILIIGNDLNHRVEENLKKSSHIIYSHNFDYDLFLEINDDKSLFDKNYFVFIDQNLPDHPDMVYRKKKNLVHREEYWKEISLILNKIKNNLKIEFKILIHPTSQPNIIEKYFDKDQIININKANFIKNCEFVICHDSTLVQLAVLWNKPIKPILPKSIIKEYTYSLNIKHFANELGLSVNLDFKKNILDQIYSSFNKEEYLKYKNKYIISSRSDHQAFFWEIFTKELFRYNEENNFKNSN